MALICFSEVQLAALNPEMRCVLCELISFLNVVCTQITYVEQPLKDLTRALGTYGVKDGDVVVLRQADRRPPPNQPAFPGKAQSVTVFRYVHYQRLTVLLLL